MIKNLLFSFLIFFSALLQFSCSSSQSDQAKENLVEKIESIPNKQDSATSPNHAEITQVKFVPPPISHEKKITLPDTSKKNNTSNKKQNVTIEITKNADNSFGYQLKVDGKLYVNQPHIPAVPGLKGFVSESDAKKCANIMKMKIEKNIMPPTVDIKDLDSLKIKY